MVSNPEERILTSGRTVRTIGIKQAFEGSDSTFPFHNDVWSPIQQLILLI
jgi:hypothetical protein